MKTDTFIPTSTPLLEVLNEKRATAEILAAIAGLPRAAQIRALRRAAQHFGLDADRPDRRRHLHLNPYQDAC